MSRRLVQKYKEKLIIISIGLSVDSQSVDLSSLVAKKKRRTETNKIESLHNVVKVERRYPRKLFNSKIFFT